MHDAMVVLLGEYAQQWLSRGEEAVPLGSEHQTLVPSAAFMTQDDYLVICAGNDDAWARLVKVLGDDSLSDVTLRSAEQRRAQREFISQHICAILRSRPREEWLTKLRKAGVPCAPVCTLDEALESTRARRNGMIVENLLPGGDWARTVGSPFRVNGRTLASSLGPPGLGQHSNEVPSIVREANLAYPPTSIGPSRLHTQRKFI
jgi:crotonobetainyl-CoA:carnitine CoA-transferase CaiB-like acyl-CoA transferase